MPGKRSAIRPSLRKATIVEFVDRQGKASVEELAEKFGISHETVRRDLNSLADEESIRKVHGGVVRMTQTREGSFDERLVKNTLAKQLIAEKLVKTIPPNQSIFMDTGSTTLLCAKALCKIPDLTVITNSARIANVFSTRSNGTRVILLGGTYRYDNAQTIGPTTVSEINRFHADQAILTIGALDTRGVSDFSEEEAQVARAMVEASESLTVVADASKLNARATFRVCGLKQIDRLVTDEIPDAKLRDALAGNGVELH